MKIVVRLVLLLALLLLVAAFFSGRIVARVAKTAIEQSTGFGVEFGGVQVNLIRPMVKVTDLELRNPPEFPHAEALSVKEAGVVLEWGSLFARTVRVENITIDVPRVVMVRTPNGSNLDALTKGNKADGKGTTRTEGKGTGENTQPKAETTKPKRSLVIDQLNVRFGEMEVRNYRKNNEEPAVLNIQVNLDRSYSNVTNVEAVAAQLTSELVVLSGASLFQQLDASLKSLNKKAESKDEKIKNVINGLQDMLK